MGLFNKKKKHEDISKIVVSSNVHNGSTIGYERLRDNILYMNADGNTKVIQIESSVASEGKTTAVCNLAVSLGLSEKKVVVVDLDFRRPKAHRMFSVSKDDGIAEFMMGKLDIDGIIKHTSYENVDIITRGAEIYNSSIVFMSEKFRELMKTLRERYDYVLLDCAPVLQVSDYIHISKLSDGVLFVVAFGQTTKTQAHEAIKELKKDNVKILGSIFTKYDRKHDDDVYKYNDYYEATED